MTASMSLVGRMVMRKACVYTSGGGGRASSTRRLILFHLTPRLGTVNMGC